MLPLKTCVRLEAALLDRSLCVSSKYCESYKRADVSLCFLSPYFDVIRSIFKSNTPLYSRVSRDSVIAASAVEKSCFVISQYYRKCNESFSPSEQHQLPGCTHHRGPLLDQQHCSTSQESTTASLLPPQTQKSQSPGPHHVHLLQRHHREHSD